LILLLIKFENEGIRIESGRKMNPLFGLALFNQRCFRKKSYWLFS
jgi:hypothetical protein